MNITRNFLTTAERLPEKTFVVGADDTAYSYAAMRGRARRFASFVTDHGAVAGDRIVLPFSSSPEYLTAYLGVLMCECTAVPVDPRSTPSHLAFVRSETQARLCVAPRERQGFGESEGDLFFPANLDE